MNGQTTIEFHGHATFSLRAADGTSLVVDPFPPEALGGALGLPPLDDRFDYGVASHAHVDHNGVSALPGPPDVIKIGRAGPFEIDRFESDHDEYGGRRRGGQVDLVRIRVDGLQIVHCSDIGRSPDDSVLDEIRGADALLVPVGGFFTIGAAQAWEWILRSNPRTIVPMHYRMERGTLPIRDLEPFLAIATWPVVQQVGKRPVGHPDDRGKVVLLERKRS